MASRVLLFVYCIANLLVNTNCISNQEDNLPGERGENVRLRLPILSRRQRFQNVSTTLEPLESTTSSTLSRTTASNIFKDSSTWAESRSTGIKVTTESTTVTITLQEETRTKELSSPTSTTGTTTTIPPAQFRSEIVNFSISTFLDGDSPSSVSTSEWQPTQGDASSSLTNLILETPITERPSSTQSYKFNSNSSDYPSPVTSYETSASVFKLTTRSANDGGASNATRTGLLFSPSRVSSTAERTWVAFPSDLASGNGTSTISSPPWRQTVRPIYTSGNASQFGSRTSSLVPIGTILPTDQQRPFSSSFVRSSATPVPDPQHTRSGNGTAPMTTKGFLTTSTISKDNTTTSNPTSSTAIEPTGAIDPMVSTTSAIPSESATPLPPPPLTTEQTAGVAIGSTAGVLLAVIAVVFLVRRHYTKRSRRVSTGSIYPKMAYIYDPPEDNGSDKGSVNGSKSTMMSGALPAPPRAEARHGDTPSASPQNETCSITRYSDPGNPFRDSGISPTNVEDTKGHSWVRTEHTTLNDLIIPSPTLGAFTEFGAQQQSLLRPETWDTGTSSSSKFDASSLANSTRDGYAPIPGDQRHSTLDFSAYAGRNPFEDELIEGVLLPVDLRTETPDSALVFVPPPTPLKSSLFAVHSTANNSNTTLVPSEVARATPTRVLGLTREASIASVSTTSRSDRFSSAYEYHSPYKQTNNSPYAASSSRLHDIVSPLSPRSPKHRGWEDFKRYSDGSDVPISPNFTPQLMLFNPPPPRSSPASVKRRSILQLRRKEPAMTGPGHVMMNSAGQPLTVQVPYKHSQASGVTGPRMSLLAKMNGLGRERYTGGMRHSDYSESDYSR